MNFIEEQLKNAQELFNNWVHEPKVSGEEMARQIAIEVIKATASKPQTYSDDVVCKSAEYKCRHFAGRSCKNLGTKAGPHSEPENQQIEDLIDQANEALAKEKGARDILEQERERALHQLTIIIGEAINTLPDKNPGESPWEDVKTLSAVVADYVLAEIEKAKKEARREVAQGLLDFDVKHCEHLKLQERLKQIIAENKE